MATGKLKSHTLTTAQQQQQQQQSNYISYQPFIMNEHTILRGTWTLALKKVSIVLIKRILKAPTSGKFSRRQIASTPILEQEHVFRLVILS